MGSLSRALGFFDILTHACDDDVVPTRELCGCVAARHVPRVIRIPKRRLPGAKKAGASYGSEASFGNFEFSRDFSVSFKMCVYIFIYYSSYSSSRSDGSITILFLRKLCFNIVFLFFAILL